MTLRPEQVTAIVDTREQTPLSLDPLPVETGTLQTGDYSIRGLQHFVAVERKSLSDLMGCVGRDRERFEKELDRLRAYPARMLVIEATWEQIEAGGWRGKITPNQAIGSLLSWIETGIPILMAGDHERAGRFVARFLFTTARRRWRELRAFGTAALAEKESA